MHPAAGRIQNLMSGARMRQVHKGTRDGRSRPPLIPRTFDKRLQMLAAS